MLGILLCIASFTAVYLASRRSLVAGLSTLAAVGYIYGILRANVPQTFSHFTFDAGVAALYLVHLPPLWRSGMPYEVRRMRSWLLLLVGWPLLLFFIPIQDPLIQFVGLRGNTYFLPFLVIGASLVPDELRRLALAFAVLNLAAFGVACAEFVLGIEPFFPRNAVTELIYRSRDIGGYGLHRIPATFSSAHAFGGTMLGTIPLLVGAWMEPGSLRRWRPVLAAAMLAASIGVFMAGARLPAVGLFGLAFLATAYGRMRLGTRIGWLAAGAVVAFVVSSSDRLQRFRTLEDTEFVAERVHGSVNKTFIENAMQYPLGNGLGGGGTSVPFFLQERIRDPVLMENEYGRIMLEQGIAGLAIWTCFIGWLVITALSARVDELALAHRLVLGMIAFSFGAGFIGTGTLTSVPGTMQLLIYCGWVCGMATRRHVAARSEVRDVLGPAEVRYG